MLGKLSSKAFTPYGIEEQRRIKNLHKNPIFIIGFVARLACILLFLPTTYQDWFIPFISNTVGNVSLNPWSTFIESGGNVVSFPYGITMLIAYLPLSFVGEFLGKLFSIESGIRIGFGLSTFCFDYGLLIAIALLTKRNSNRLLLLLYWCSPLIVYINYIHGQLDIVPVMLLFWSICLVYWNRYKSAGLLLSFAVCCKFSMVVAIPLLLIFIHRKRGIGSEIIEFCAVTTISLLALTIPFLNSSGFIEMVLNTRESARVISVAIPYAENLNLYVVPIVYLLSLYLVWRLDRITKDLFILGTGISFFSLLIFLPPGPGWFLWVVPFLIYYQLTSKKDVIGIALVFNIVCLLYIALYSTGASVLFLNQGIEKYNFVSKELSLGGASLRSVIFTFLQAFSILLVIRMYTYGIQKNGFYRFSSKPFIINFSGQAKGLRSDVVKSLSSLIGDNKVNVMALEESTSLMSSKISEPEEKSYASAIRYMEFANTLKAAQDQNSLIYKKSLKIDNRTRGDQIKTIWANLRSSFKIIGKDYLFLSNGFFISNGPLRDLVRLQVKVNHDVGVEAKNTIYSQPDNLKDIVFWVSSINESSASLKKRLITYLPLGFLHDELFRMLIAICALHIDKEVTEDQQWVKISFEGDADSEDISHIARMVIPQIEDFSLIEDHWKSGYLGIMQLIILATISDELQHHYDYKTRI